MIVDREPPHSRDLENAVLGAALFDNSVALEVTHRLVSDDFFGSVQRAVFDAISSLVSSGGLVDPILVKDALSDEQRHEFINIMGSGSLSFQVPQQIDEIKKMSEARRVIRVCNDVEIAAYNLDSESAVSDALSELVSLDSSASNGARSVSDLIGERLNSAKTPEDFLRVSGFDSIHIFGGDFIVIGGRPGAGKTAYALQLALDWAKEVPVMFYSYEMTEMQLTDRIIAAHSPHTVTQIEDGLDDMDVDIIEKFMDESVLSSQFYIRRAAGMTNNELFADMYRFKARGGKVVVIDYLQLAADKSKMGLVHDTTIFSNKLRRVALDSGLTVVAVAQLNRGSADRSAVTMPIISDLRESGAIEQDATHICLLMAVPNPKYSRQGADFITNVTTVFMRYTNEMLDAGTGDPDDDKVFVTVDWAKVRQGKRCRWCFIFDGSKMTFKPIERLTGIRVNQEPYDGRLDLDE